MLACHSLHLCSGGLWQLLAAPCEEVGKLRRLPVKAIYFGITEGATRGTERNSVVSIPSPPGQNEPLF